MACAHRYRVEAQDDGTGAIKCTRCGDIRTDGLSLEDTRTEEIADRIRWERKRRESPLWLPPDISAPIKH